MNLDFLFYGINFKQTFFFSKVLKNAFQAFDYDREGLIDCDQVSTILEMLGQKLDDKTVKGLIREVKNDPKATKLNFNEFAMLAGRFVEVEEDVNAIAEELKEAFRLYDKEGKGYLTTEVLRDILHELDDKLSNEDLDMMIDEIDADGSGTVDFDGKLVTL